MWVLLGTGSIIFAINSFSVFKKKAYFSLMIVLACILGFAGCNNRSMNYIP